MGPVRGVVPTETKRELPNHRIRECSPSKFVASVADAVRPCTGRQRAAKACGATTALVANGVGGSPPCARGAFDMLTSNDLPEWVPLRDVGSLQRLSDGVESSQGVRERRRRKRSTNERE